MRNTVWRSSCRISTFVLLAVLSWAAVLPLAAHAQRKIEDSVAERAKACAACHGKEGRATGDGYFPRIAGKPAGYLYNQLVNFRDGRRQQYPLMTYMVGHMSDDYLKELADYFARLDFPYPPPQANKESAQVLLRGEALVRHGDPARKVPACVACHGQNLTGLSPAVPGLLGLPRDYLNSQFGAWRNGARRAAAPDCMADISRRLSAEEVSAVSAWLSSQRMPASSAPLPAGSLKLPVQCGSVAR